MAGKKEKKSIGNTLFRALFETPVEKKRGGKTEEVLEAKVLEDKVYEGVPVQKRKRKTTTQIKKETEEFDRLIAERLDAEKGITEAAEKQLEEISKRPKRKRIMREPSPEDALSNEPKEVLAEVAETLEEETEWPEPEGVELPKEELGKGLLNKLEQQQEKEPENTDTFWDASEYDLGDEEIPDEEEQKGKKKGKKK
ncbi:hypothetical protein ACFLQ2_04255 [archaeon]